MRVNPRAAFRFSEIAGSARRSAAPKALRVDDAPSFSAETIDDAGHYIVPPRDVLRRMGYAQLSALPGFVVGRKGVGQVRFLAPVDVTKVPLDATLFTRVVRIEPRCVTLYPEDAEGAQTTPAVGSGLNVPAEIRLEGCWPASLATREPIREMDDPHVADHVAGLRAREGATFVDYFADTGTWVFRVDHF